MALTESWLKAQYGKSKTKELVKADRDGLCARVSPKGKVTYSLRYYYNSSRKRIDLGSYPLMSLKEARGEALRLRRTNSSETKFEETICNREFKSNLRVRGYPDYLVNNVLAEVKFINSKNHKECEAD